MRTLGDSLVIDGLIVDDEVAVRLAAERERSGEDPAKLVRDAVEIGARVLDREQAGANAEFVRTEFERAAASLNAQFTERAGVVAEQLDASVARVFSPENGQLQQELDKLFSDGSAASVQNRVRELVAETLARSRADLVRQFSAADENNPLAEFKTRAVATIEQAAARSDLMQKDLLQKMAELEKQLEALRVEKSSLEELEAERERGTAKGRSFEERVAELVDRIALAQGDVAEAVGDVKEATGKVGDVVVDICAADGPARGRVVFEAKDKRLSRPAALKELDDAMAERSAGFGVLVVPTEEELPAKTEPLREYNGDKLVVVLGPDSGELVLELAYRLARARVLMTRDDAAGIDAGAVAATVERAQQALCEELRIKQQLTGAQTSIERARDLVQGMTAQLRGQLDEIDVLLRAGG